MYLSKIYIKNFRGIKELLVEFNKKLNIIIGANGQMKTALVDAIRLFYAWGDANRDLEITKDDFHIEIVPTDDGGVDVDQAKKIDIVYQFMELSDDQKGAFYQYLVVNDDESVVARVHLTYELKENGKVWCNYITGKEESGMKADWATMQHFCSYHLSALRDSTRDLMSTRNNLLGRVIKRKIDRAGSEDEVKNIMVAANQQLLARQEVSETKDGINNNLKEINKTELRAVGLNIASNRVECVVNVIKPYLPHSETSTDGFVLSQNSLGFNNLIYIASVLGDIKDCHVDDKVSIYALTIEEPEAHLHPQLQVNLYDFLKNADDNENSQTFITTHSPTLTSKIPLDNLILLKDNKGYCVGKCFELRDTENIVRDVASHNRKLTAQEVLGYKKMIARYFDVTRSQLLFSNGCLFIEGISECQLMETFSKLIGKSLSAHQIEIVDTDGTAFYQFLMLFNSTDTAKRLPMKAAFITDEDQFTDSKNREYDLDSIVMNNYEKLNNLRDNINSGSVNGRVNNMNAMKNGQADILVCSGKKTLEYQICRANVNASKDETKASWLYELIKEENPDGIGNVDTYLGTLGEGAMSDEQQQNVALLMWKCIPCKAGFAQTLNAFLLDKLESGGDMKFMVPSYICDAINHLVP